MSRQKPGVLAADAPSLTIAGETHRRLREHLFPGDDHEAAAIALCAQIPGPRVRYLVRQLLLVPYADCVRTRDAITWPGAWLERAIDLAEAEGLMILLIHSHPGGMLAFSTVDDNSDRIVMPCLAAAVPRPHGSAIMTGEGALLARTYGNGFGPTSIELVMVVSDDIEFWWRDAPRKKRPLAFTSAMTAELSRLTAVIVGTSGTGSIMVEQASRLGFGRIIAIDFDVMKLRNLNRILNAKLSDALKERLKVEMLAEAIDAVHGYKVLDPVPLNINKREAVLAASQGDVLFSCVDTFEGRHFCDLMAAAFLMPLVDVGVTIPVRETNDGHAIADVCGRVDYVQPGGSTLLDREVWTPAKLSAEYLKNADEAAHREQVQAGYMPGLAEEAPSVIALNMRAASAAMMEFIARAYPFRLDPNRNYARTLFSLAAMDEDYFAEDRFTRADSPRFARGDVEPLLGLPSLKARKKQCA
jgi:hypothetical protein